MATSEGLVGFDEEGRLIPGLAERWIVTDDGLSHIFRLRETAWPDGTRLTGESAAGALRLALTRLRGTSLAQEADGIEAIVARTGRVIEVQTARANPDLLRLLAQPELALLRKGAGIGAMRLSREGNTARLMPETSYPVRQSVNLGNDGEAGPAKLYPLAASQAIAMFRDGKVDAVLEGRWMDLPAARSLGLGQGTLLFDPVSGLFGLIVTNENGFLSQPGNREAIAMAIDRDAIADSFGVSGWNPSNRLVATGVEDDTGSVGERWNGLDRDARQAEASRRVALWLEGNDRPNLRLALPAGPGADELFAMLRADFGAIGLRVRRVGSTDEADLRIFDEVARFARATWFMDQLSCRVRPAACSPEADLLLSRARAATDAGTRAELLADAEAQLTIANTFIPFGPPLRWTVTRRGLKGIAPNRWGIHPLNAIGGS